jgi:DNA sulfur modification protein DndC
MTDIIRDVNAAIEYTQDVLSRIPDRETWCIPQSGGEDSRATAQVTLALIEQGRVQAPRRMVFYMADTLLEFERFIAQAKVSLQSLKDKATSLGIEAHTFITMPLPQDDYWVRILGYGFVPPTAHMRTCTDKLKIVPPAKILRRLGWDNAPILLGVRRGESDRRDAILSCTLGGECGPDYQYLRLIRRASSAQKAVAPIKAWGTCAVWDWLVLKAPEYGFDNSELADLYGPDGSLRYGCWCCPLCICHSPIQRLASCSSSRIRFFVLTAQHGSRRIARWFCGATARYTTGGYRWSFVSECSSGCSILSSGGIIHFCPTGRSRPFKRSGCGASRCLTCKPMRKGKSRCR